MNDNLHNQAPIDAEAMEQQAEQHVFEGEEAEMLENAPKPEEQEDELAKLKAQLEKEKSDYLFLMADFDNFRKRVIKEKADLIKNAAEKALKGLLPIVDDFERGLAATENAESVDSVREGMQLIYNKLVKYLGDNGVVAMNTETGADFDADMHDAIATVPAPSEDVKGKIIDTTQKGYMLNDKVLRHAKVVVGQ